MKTTYKALIFAAFLAFTATCMPGKPEAQSCISSFMEPWIEAKFAKGYLDSIQFAKPDIRADIVEALTTLEVKFGQPLKYRSYGSASSRSFKTGEARLALKYSIKHDFGSSQHVFTFANDPEDRANCIMVSYKSFDS